MTRYDCGSTECKYLTAPGKNINCNPCQCDVCPYCCETIKGFGAHSRETHADWCEQKDFRGPGILLRLTVGM